mmetsp:Transcript_48948/g.72770  ORF Transcript_48948/g.72770 Transcript_48948/m.72770 type:complete len:171 (-) Transcript_48948:486-998(-)|eukprot:CAMPEP_0195518636 /NCGR_PEP_ID=MMETSP0794_2-20130614/13381_1 /TAXON_ID=515487 /ORGANISM="Stephanopyxis turris, Strain CCMP 815" /LENGTH=170 /DNA_ID=CAMNT_0040647649 /DNA_START=58 /DNA_END=570 /DNA_ORIENTATION=+
MVISKKLQMFFLLFCSILASLGEARTFRFGTVWFKRPYKGPQCVVEIVGADIAVLPNSDFDRWSKPDIMVECKHSNGKRDTQIEPNTFRPRFLFTAKMPYESDRGFCFTVYDVNVVESNEVIGRCFISSKQAKESIKSDSGILLSIGDGIGTLKVKISSAPQLNTTKALV